MGVAIYGGYYKGRLEEPEYCLWLQGRAFKVGLMPPSTEWDYKFFSFWQGHFVGFYEAHRLLSRFVPEPASAALLLTTAFGIELAEMSVFKTSPVNLGDLAAGALGVAFASLRRRGYFESWGFAWHWGEFAGVSEWEDMGFTWIDGNNLPDSYGPFAFGVRGNWARGYWEIGVSCGDTRRILKHPLDFGYASGFYLDGLALGGEAFSLYTAGPGVYGRVSLTLR